MFKKHVTEQLSAYCHGQLAIEDARRIAEHLLGCRRCRKRYEEIKLGVQLLGQLPPVSAPASLWNEIENEWENGRAGAREQASAHSPILPFSRSPIRFLRPRIIALAAMLLVGLGMAVAWYTMRSPMPAWEVARLAGAPKVGSDHIGETGRLEVGEWLETDSSSRARINIGQIGEVEIEPNTRVRLIQARLTDHRLALARGTLHALIWAPPRLFFVETPSAVAVDLGCAYTLTVDDAGAGLLHVESGWVAFELNGRESFVPAGARCETRPVVGPGTPYFEDASEAFQRALAQFDFEQGGAEALNVVLTEARQEDALTLWHLFSRVSEAERGRVYDRLATLIPPPKGVSRDGVLRREKRMLDLWWNELGLGDTDWWRFWKGPWPPQAK